MLYKNSKKVATLFSEKWFEARLNKHFKIIKTDAGDQVLSKFYIAKRYG